MNKERYLIENIPETNTTIYRHLNNCRDTKLPSLCLAIVCNNKNHTVYLQLENKCFFDATETFSLFWNLRGQGILGELSYRRENQMGDYLFATELVKFIDLGFEINYNGMQIFSPQSAQAFIETFRDYNFLLSQGYNPTNAI